MTLSAFRGLYIYIFKKQKKPGEGGRTNKKTKDKSVMLSKKIVTFYHCVAGFTVIFSAARTWFFGEFTSGNCPCKTNGPCPGCTPVLTTKSRVGKYVVSFTREDVVPDKRIKKQMSQVDPLITTYAIKLSRPTTMMCLCVAGNIAVSALMG